MSVTSLRFSSSNTGEGEHQRHGFERERKPSAASEQAAEQAAAEKQAVEEAAADKAMEEAKASARAPQGTEETALSTKALDKYGLPLQGAVAEYSRRALEREGRAEQVKAVIWHEDTAYPPILAQGKKNIYDFTDDIPKHVKPMYHYQWMQQREYFQRNRNVAPLWQRVVQWGLIGGFLLGVGFLVVISRIWLEQPKEIAALRNEMLQQAYGRVLELGAGQGTNVGLYPYAVHEIMMVDQNAQQLQRLRYRLPKTAYPKYDVRHMKTENLEQFGDHEFDCIVDMFGLCHYRDPVMVLRQMQRVVKPTGVILLLEHGRTEYTVVNWILDWFSDRHTVNTHGCKWNLPMKEYFKEARLEVKEIRTMHYGTTHYLVAYPENLEAIATVKIDDPGLQPQAA